MAREDRPALRPLLTWSAIFQRAPLGFDSGTAGIALEDLKSTIRRYSQQPHELRAAAAVLGAGFWTGLAALALLLGIGLSAERLCPRSWRRSWIRARRLFSRSRIWQAAVAVAQRIALPAVALAGWSLGASLAGAQGGAPVQTVEWLLLIWLSHRALDETAKQVSGRLLPRPETRDLYREIRGLLLFAGWWLAGWVLLAAAAYRDEVIRLWVFSGHLVLVLGAFGLLVRRDRLMGLLPPTQGRLLNLFRQVLRGVYLPAVFASLALALLWVFGYRTLASVALGRSWAVVGICIAAYVVFRLVMGALSCTILGENQRSETSAEALLATRRLVGLIVGLIALSLCLHALGVAEGLRELAERPLVVAGAFRLSGRVLWGSFVILVGVVMISGCLQALLALRVYPGLNVGAGEAYALNRLVHYALIAFAVVVVLHRLGLSPESLALVLGGLSVGIGFGLQDIARNVASGLILLIGRQVRKGDVITADDRMGTVQSVNLRSTVVKTFDNLDLIIPNAKLLENTLVNWTHSGTLSRTHISFGVAYGSDLRGVMEIALRVANAHPEVSKARPPDVWITAMGESAITLSLLVWVDIVASVRPRVVTDIYCTLTDELAAAGIDIPFPQRDLNLRSGVPWEELLAALGSRGGQGEGGNGRASNGEARSLSPSPQPEEIRNRGR